MKDSGRPVFQLSIKEIEKGIIEHEAVARADDAAAPSVHNGASEESVLGMM